jgi:hypothetical protein
MNATRWSEVERLYHATLERPAGERAAFLIEASAGDDDLRREVESLLTYRTKDFIEPPAHPQRSGVTCDLEGGSQPSR